MDTQNLDLKSIYEKYAAGLFSYGMGICRDKSLVEDSLHELFLEIHTNPDPFSKATDTKRYLFACLRNKIYRALRTTPEYVDISQWEIPEEGSSPEASVLAREQNENDLKFAGEMLASLNSHQREIMFLRFNERMSFKEIARLMGISSQSAQNLFQRSITKLRKLTLAKKETIIK